MRARLVRFEALDSRDSNSLWLKYFRRSHGDIIGAYSDEVKHFQECPDIKSKKSNKVLKDKGIFRREFAALGFIWVYCWVVMG